MNLDYIYLLSFVFFFISFISLGYIVRNRLIEVSIFKMFTQKKIKVSINKFINFSLYLAQGDYIPYEKYEIWRFYFPV